MKFEDKNEPKIPEFCSENGDNLQIMVKKVTLTNKNIKNMLKINKVYTKFII